MKTKQQIQNWETLYDKPISPTEYGEICQNLNGFFGILKQWSDNEERKLSENGQDNNKRSSILPLTPR